MTQSPKKGRIEPKIADARVSNQMNSLTDKISQNFKGMLETISKKPKIFSTKSLTDRPEANDSIYELYGESPLSNNNRSKNNVTNVMQGGNNKRNAANNNNNNNINSYSKSNNK